MEAGIEQHENSKPEHPKKAKGKPGKQPTWSSGAKTFVGTASRVQSRIWFTVSDGTLNEIFSPDVDQANTRSVRFLVSDEAGFFSDEADDANHVVSWVKAGAPACRIETTCKRGRYKLIKEIITDPVRDTLLLRVHFEETGDAAGPPLKLFLHIDAHIGDKGAGNTAWVGQYKGARMLMAHRETLCAAVMMKPPMKRACAGYTGVSDGLAALAAAKPLPAANIADEGNVGLTAELDTSEGGTVLISLAFGGDSAEAGQQARAGILQNFDKTRDLFLRGWDKCQGEYDDVPDLSASGLNMYRVSTAVLEVHQSKRFRGGFVASLSLPWGFARSDKYVAGYHVVWPRDMVETSMGKLCSGDAESARSNLFFMSCVQNADGRWPQNMWLDGTMHWGALQMDGIALPILLADRLRRDNALDGYDASDLVLQATRVLLRYGPVTEQDRWEALAGYSPYTMATEVAALLAAAHFAEMANDPEGAEFLRQTADAWNEAVDEFTYVEGTELAKKVGVRGYYVRIAPAKRVQRNSLHGLTVSMSNVKFGERLQLAEKIVSPDALALVRFGLRSAHDQRMVDTVRVLDATLKREMRTGPGWVRSSHDGYGEKEDGSPFKKRGVGRCWPLLGGERGHYEIAAGNHQGALELLQTMARQTSECGLLPEQVWDQADIPERRLINGKPTGSSMPLVWAHAEYIKLLRSLHEGRVWDMPIDPVERYQEKQVRADFQIWTPEQRRGYLAQGKKLRIDLPEAAVVRWKAGSQGTEVETQGNIFGVHYALLGTERIEAGESVRVEIRPRNQDGEMKPMKARVIVSAPR